MQFDSCWKAFCTFADQWLTLGMYSVCVRNLNLTDKTVQPKFRRWKRPIRKKIVIKILRNTNNQNNLPASGLIYNSVSECGSCPLWFKKCNDLLFFFVLVVIQLRLQSWERESIVQFVRWLRLSHYSSRPVWYSYHRWPDMGVFLLQTKSRTHQQSQPWVTHSLEVC